MTCFRTKEGRNVKSLCRNQTEYLRFYRAIERGCSFEEALKCIHKKSPKGRHSERTEIMKKVLDNYSEKVYFTIVGRCRRNRSSLEDAIKWAAQTGRVTVKKRYREQYLKRS